MKDRNLVLAPITVMVVSDGIPDMRDAKIKSGSPASYQQIDLSPLDYLSKNITVRLVYASPKAGDNRVRRMFQRRAPPEDLVHVRRAG